jgi:prostaglandin-endoperoxide synthase 2
MSLPEWLGRLLTDALDSPFPAIRELANKKVINRLGYAVEPRPGPISMAAPYTTWRGLTDRTYSGRQLPEADEGYTENLPPVEDVLALFKREKEELDDRTSLLFPFFAQWFTDR